MILTSNSFDFITSLTITKPFLVPDLVKISKITNLGVLEITNNREMDDAIGDRIVRAWHYACLNEGAFKVLRVLRLLGHEYLTSNTLSLITDFPCLGVYDVRGCDFGPGAHAHAQKLGWKSKLLSRLSCGSSRLALVTEDCEVEETSNSSSKRRSSSKLKEIESSTGKQGPRTTASQSWDATKAWETENWLAFTRLGKLRGDSDLIRARVNAGKQFPVGNWRVNSIPIASLCLGPVSMAFSTPRGFIFTRIEAPSPAAAKTDLNPTPLQKLNGTGCSPAKTLQGPNVLRAKKRKLDDVLGSFL